MADIYYSPGYICGPSFSSLCAASFIKVDSGSDCAGGDSGGPYYVGHVAYGIQHSGNSGGGYCTFMALDYLAELGVYVLN